MSPQDNNPLASAPAFDLGDIYYTLFRHKWAILICSLLGLGSAYAYFKLKPPPYQSQARLFIRYVVTEGKSPGPPRDDAVTKSPDQRGETIINSELEILTSLDLAHQVAQNIGPEKILAKINGGKNLNDAAAVVRSGLLAEVARGSSVLRISFEHPDRDIVQPVLQELVDSYLKKHNEIHLAVGMVGDFLTHETDDLRARLAQTEEELRKATNKAGIISLEDSKKAYVEQIARLRQDIFNAQAELAAQTSILQNISKPAAPTTPQNESLPVPPEQVAAYQKICARLANLQKSEQEYLINFTEESNRVKAVRTQIAAAESQKKKLETEFPALAELPIARTTAPGQSTGGLDPIALTAQINALQAKIKVLTSQLEEVRTEVTTMDQMTTTILELRRRKELEEGNYRYFSASLEQSRINEALGSGRVSNISPIQTPSPPSRDWSKKLKLLAMISVSGIAVGLGWAFAFEMFIDRSIRRPADIERVLQVPLFLSIPKLERNGRLAGGNTSSTKLLPPSKPSAPGENPATPENLPATLSAESLALVPFHETLRDRLISYFESINLRHKPKLVAVTGLGNDSGVTTTAAGLARSLSETGEGNVLLVDMTQGQGSAQHFYKGTTAVGLDQLLATRGDAQVQDHLFVVGDNSGSDRLSKSMPQRFNQLVPKLKASDFDYIIFDMPPVSQISITPRLAGFMDMVLMVIESEKSDREIAQRASALLSKANTNVGVVLNKTKTYIPSVLHQDREFLLGS